MLCLYVIAALFLITFTDYTKVHAFVLSVKRCQLHLVSLISARF